LKRIVESEKLIKNQYLMKTVVQNLKKSQNHKKDVW